MNVSLTPELEELVERKVASGRYNSRSEVVREALRLLEERDQLHEWKREELRREIRKGLKQLDEGLGEERDKEVFLARAEKLYEERKAQQ